MKTLDALLVATSVSIAGVSGDADLDCFIGESGGTIKFYKNTGNQDDPAFIVQSATNPYNNMYTFNAGSNPAPHCFDVDGDYDFDCFMGMADGTIKMYKNTGSSTAAAFTLADTATNPFNGVDVGVAAVMDCVDLDNDGDIDCVFGHSTGAFAYYKNTGTSSSPTYTLQSGAADDPFDGKTITDGFATPTFADLDGDLDYDVIIGDATGNLHYYENTGTRTAPVFTVKTGTDSPFNGISLGQTYSAPECVDFDYDGDIDCFVGNLGGTIDYLYNQGSSTSVNFLLTTASTVPTKQAAIGELYTADVGANSILSCVDVDASCTAYNNCNNHGICKAPNTCVCYDGWGSATDIATWKSPDCSKRTCPSGKAWVDVPTDTTTAHAQAECSNMGVCDRASGTCKCFPGFTGDACQRMKCPSATTHECSGHGVCVSMSRMATMTNALPLSAATTYTGAESTTTWDQDMAYGCVCDSDWTVGLGSGETQQPQWFGPDCSKKRCPTGDDPGTATVDETDCNGKVADGGYGTGVSGNKCHIDCSGRGECDYMTGLCTCYDGYHGDNCGTIDQI